MALFIKSPLEKLYAKSYKLKALGSLPPALEALYTDTVFDDKSCLFEHEIISLDFETTGLDFNEDIVLSMGYVIIKNGAIDFNTSCHKYLNVQNVIKSGSAIINQITPEQLISGEDTQQAFDELLSLMRNKIVLCHAATIEKNFILHHYGLEADSSVPLVFLDTLKLERSLVSYSGNVSDLSLSAIRKKRQLPSYVAHNALADSVATAELFLCQVRDIFGKETPTLGPLYKRSI